MGLIAQYKLNDDLANTNVIETLGNHPGTLQGGDNTEDLSITGKINKAFHFNAVDDYISVADSNFVEYADFSISFWIRSDGDTPQLRICGQSDGAGTQNKWGIDYNIITGGAWTFFMDGVPGLQKINFYFNIYWIHGWYHFVFVRQGNQWKMFVDNVQTGGTQTNSSTIPNSTGDLRIGSDGEGIGFVPGILDDVRIYNHALSTDEINFLWNSGNGTEQLIPYEEVLESDTLTLSDEIELSLSLEKALKEESLTLTDEIHVAFIKQQELLDTMALSDNIDVLLSKELADTLTLSDAIIIDTVEPSVNDFNNIFGMVSGAIKDINNKFGILAESKSDINNRVGFLKSWQVPGDAGYQSLGKTYVKVYINSVEQTDAIINSITISKILNGSHTATFKLGRPYDNTKPNQESVVEIKYHVWTLYRGYITQITPASNPEEIKIICQDDFWKNNKTKKYFNVGHKPSDDFELYYNYISNALSTQFNWSPGIGSFVPQAMNLFGMGSSDCINSLISNSGNYNWFYHVNKSNGQVSKKLWTAGQGDIINLEEQEIGKNLGLYQVITHSFGESIGRIINKFRVQMGDLIWRRFNDTGGFKEYAGYRWSQYLGQIFPKWNDNYERVATDNYEPAHIASTPEEIATYGKGGIVPQKGTSGVFRHSIDENDLYKDVFVKYDLPGLNRDFESWSDKVSPQIIVRFPFFAGWKLSGSLKAPELGWFPLGFRYRIPEGFTIDYEKGEVIFNEPVYLYQSNSDGDITDIKRAKLEIAIYKERYYSDTEDPSDDPETDIANPLMFFTEKCGDYPETIIENLNLSGLGIQIGGWEIVGRDDNNKPIYRYTPSWNDTAFAKDLANWRLTQNCDKKVNGTAEVTIDTICFYNINLSNRIMIEGVIENPLNITSISYNIGSWKVSLGLENGRYFKRSVSIQSRGE